MEEEKENSSGMVFLVQLELHARAISHTDVLCNEYVVYGDDIDLVDTLRLELVVFLNVSRRLRGARRRKGSGYANLFYRIYLFLSCGKKK